MTSMLTPLIYWQLILSLFKDWQVGKFEIEKFATAWEYNKAIKADHFNHLLATTTLETCEA